MHNVPQRAAPQQARAIATRQKLLQATADSLCEVGCSGTTTTVVAERAGVSQGALFKHFGSKHQLIASTMEYLFDRLFDSFRTAFASSAEDEDRLSCVLRELWAVFLTPELYAVVELYIAARTDEPLRLALVPVLGQHRSNLANEARQLFPQAADHNPNFDVAVDGILSTFQGAAMSAAVLQDFSGAAAFAEFLERVCRRELEPPYGAE